MAQVMQWPPAIRNYMSKVKLKYQHVIANLPLLTASLITTTVEPRLSKSPLSELSVIRTLAILNFKITKR